MCGTLMYQACLGIESIKEDLFRLDYCVGKILELSAVTTDTQERILEFAQSRPEIYNCVDIACDYSSRLQSALESMTEQLETIGEQSAQQTDDITRQGDL